MRNSASKKKKMPKGATTRLDAAFEDIIHSPPVQMSNRLAGGWLSSRLVWRSRRIKMSRKHSRVQTPQAAMQKGKKSEFTKNQEGASVLSNINKKLCTSNDDTARQLLRRQYLGVVLEVPEDDNDASSATEIQIITDLFFHEGNGRQSQGCWYVSTKPAVEAKVCMHSSVKYEAASTGDRLDIKIASGTKKNPGLGTYLMPLIL
jgi:hypothetical protein